MNINALLINPAPEAPRVSPSNPPFIPAPSPSTSAAKLPTPPLSTSKPMTHKRKRHDPKPIWAVREDEVMDDQPLQPPQPPQSLQPLQQSRPQPPPAVQRNGTQPQTSRELQGYERPITNDPRMYDEISRKVCDFLWDNVVENALVRNAIAESPATQVEIEARWGQIQERHGGGRLRGMHDTECIIRKDVLEQMKFESTMSLEQHQKMNKFLNNQVQLSKHPNALRAEINYKHTREVDMFYQLDQDGFSLLPHHTKEMIAQSNARQRIRVTRDARTEGVLAKVIKLRIANLEISSPQTEWDYRIGINLEINFPGPVEGLSPATEHGRNAESLERRKDRVSYSWLNAYQIDLTQVSQAQGKNHELELELDSKVLINAAEKVKRGEENDFENLVSGMMNNLRILSREVTPAGVKALP
ncbi:mRNA triphosphatase CET1 [Lindgomyces ingoldianus]|uniref:mRNA triphosphatase CET1 n=1 Tax=Lindgomyces ingoldianus TaxID=673940 RepID=A0ACB6RB81_9PLEO|nr:mRNA triphosphatase CET1 [Lindgomyces ingoldianus]KAF2476499.1 mRNA triphosphatase CET1 [Lindgomyces ingoldianus]